MAFLRNVIMSRWRCIFSHIRSWFLLLRVLEELVAWIMLESYSRSFWCLDQRTWRNRWCAVLSWISWRTCLGQACSTWRRSRHSGLWGILSSFRLCKLCWASWRWWSLKFHVALSIDARLNLAGAILFALSDNILVREIFGVETLISSLVKLMESAMHEIISTSFSKLSQMHLSPNEIDLL